VLQFLFSFHRVIKAGTLFTRRALAKVQASIKEIIPGAMIMWQEISRLYILMSSLQKRERNNMDKGMYARCKGKKMEKLKVLSLSRL